MRNFWIVLGFVPFFCVSEKSPFYQVLRGARLTLPDHEKIFILPVKIKNILRISFDSRMFFVLKTTSDIFAISDGTVIKIDKKLKYIKIKHFQNGKALLAKYFGIDEILVKVGSKIKQKQKIGSASGHFSLQTRVEDVIINIFAYIKFSEDEKKQILLVV